MPPAADASRRVRSSFAHGVHRLHVEHNAGRAYAAGSLLTLACRGRAASGRWWRQAGPSGALCPMVVPRWTGPPTQRLVPTHNTQQLERDLSVRWLGSAGGSLASAARRGAQVTGAPGDLASGLPTGPRLVKGSRRRAEAAQRWTWRAVHRRLCSVPRRSGGVKPPRTHAATVGGATRKV